VVWPTYAMFVKLEIGYCHIHCIANSLGMSVNDRIIQRMHLTVRSLIK
jgi:hypothetical protein